MTRRILFSISLLLSSFVFVWAQPTFTVADEMADKGDMVEIDVTVDDFDNLLSFQYSHNYDSLVLEFVDVINKNTTLGGIQHQGPVMGGAVGNGQLTLNWFDGNLQPKTLPNGTRVYTIVFEVIGEPCDSTFVTFSSDPRKIEVLDENYEDVGMTGNEGKFKIPGAGCEGMGGGDDLVIKANQVSGKNGEVVCLNVRVDEFTDIESMQFSINWNNSIATFNRVENFNSVLSGLGSANFNESSPGKLRCIWDNNQGVGSTVPNNAQIFDICFDVVGSAGQMTDVDFTNDPVAIEFFNSMGEVPHDTRSGKITVMSGMGGGDTKLILGDGGGNLNETFCIPLSFDGFTNVESIQFTIRYDKALLAFVEAKDFAVLPGWGIANFSNTPAGIIRVVWDEPNGSTVNIATESRVANLCFQSLSCDTTTQVVFSDDPLAIEIFSSSGVLAHTTEAGDITLEDCIVAPLEVELIEVIPSKCKGDCKGAIQIMTRFGTGPFVYEWTGPTPSNDKNPTNLCEGVYNLKVTDQGDNDRMVTLGPITITDPDALVISDVNITPDLGGCSGEIELTVTGGTPQYFYSFRPSNQTTNPATGFCKGDSVWGFVNDMNNCVVFMDTFVIPGEPLVITSCDVIEPLCFGDCTGEIDITVEGGCGNFTYEWTGPSGGGLVANAEDQTMLCAGNYTVTVRDEAGGEDTKVVVVNQPDSVKISLDDIMNGERGSIFVTISGGTPMSGNQYVIKWLDSLGNLVSQDEDLLDVVRGKYTIMVTDDNGCGGMMMYTIVKDTLGVLVNTSTNPSGDEISCFGDCDGEITLTVSGGSGMYDYMWSHDALLNDNVATDLCADFYTVTVTDAVSGSIKIVGPIEMNEPDELTGSVTEMSCATSEGASNAAYTVDAEGGAAPYNYLWCNNNTAKVAQNLVGGSTCNVLITDANGCQVFVDDFEVCFDNVGGPSDCDECLIGRQVITPNADGRNDNLEICCINEARFADNQLMIFNRWGEMVNSYSNYSNQWNGVDENGDEVTEGGYMWVLKINLTTGESRVVRGTVIVLRNK